MTPFIGVRISWLILAKKALLPVLQSFDSSIGKLRALLLVSAPETLLPDFYPVDDLDTETTETEGRRKKSSDTLRFTRRQYRTVDQQSAGGDQNFRLATIDT